MEAFLDKFLSPCERAYKVWYSKTFFWVWEKQCTDPTQFIADQTFKDLKCGADGLILYLLLMSEKFPDTEIVSHFLGSDPNEQVYCHVRVSQSAGRKTNLDCITLGCGLEKINVRSSLTGTDEFQIAHTRGRTVYKKAVPLNSDNSSDSSEKKKVPVWKGKDVNEQSLRNSMKNGTKACIEDCQALNFPFFSGVTPDKIPRTNPLVAGYSESHHLDENNKDEEDLDNVSDNEEDDPEHASLISTPLGYLHLKTAEAIYLNGGKTTFGAKSRQSRFYTNCFSEHCTMKAYNSNKRCCRKGIINIGDRVNLYTFQDKVKSNSKVRGQLRFISKNFDPMGFYCPEHHSLPVNAWVWSNNQYIRCVF